MSQNIENNFKSTELLREIISLSVNFTTPDQILSKIVYKSGKFFKADRCFCVDYFSAQNKFLPIRFNQVYTTLNDAEEVVKLSFSKEESDELLDAVLNKQKVLVINNESEVPERLKEFFKNYNIKSALIAPKIFRNEAVGIFILTYTNQYKTFTEEEYSLFYSIAVESAIIISQNISDKELHDLNNKNQLLISINNNILASSNINEAIEKIVKEVGQVFNSDRCVFRFYDQATRSIMPIFAEYSRKKECLSVKDNIKYNQICDNFIINKVFEKKSELIVSNPNDSKYPEELRKTFKQFNVKTSLMSPIFYQNTPCGVLCIVNTESSRKWLKTEINFLKLITQQSAFSIRLFQLNNRLKKTLAVEKSLREIFTRIRSTNNFQQIQDLLTSELQDVFSAELVLHLHKDEKNNYYIKNEKNTFINKKTDKNITFPEKDITWFAPNQSAVTVAINRIDELPDNDLYRYLKALGIKSFLINIVPEHSKPEIFCVTMICSSSPRKWLPEEVSFLKLIIDTVFILCQELKHKQEVEEIKNTFIATLTHDLRSPIIAEQKALEFIVARDKSTPLCEYSEFLVDIYKTNEELLRMINNILTSYHYESAHIELDLAAENIQDLINEAVKHLTYLAQDKNCNINVDIKDDLPPVLIDRDEIRRVLINLISNALAHSKPNTTLQVSAKRYNSDQIIVIVEDHGKGIPEEEKSKIFQKYPTRKRRVGTGLGLFVAKQAVEKHNGKIWFESAEGKGTTFFFTLPIVKK